MEKNMEKKYGEFFKQMKEFKKQQDEQKNRGLNNYNMVNVVRKANKEVGMHSNVIYSLINPNGSHYQGDLFLKIFLKNILPKDIKEFGGNIEVQKEELTSKNKRIDFTIKSDTYFIGIEMKVNASDGEKQLYDYWIDLKEKARQDNQQTVLMFYLTKYGKEAPRCSRCNIKSSESNEQECISNPEVINISFKKEILQWINESQKEIKNITNLNEAFNNYRTIVQKITKTYKGNIMTLDEFIQDKGLLEDFFKFTSKETADKAKGVILHRFFESLSSLLIKEGLHNWDKEIKMVHTEEKCINYFTGKKEYDFGIFHKISDKFLFCAVLGKNDLHFGIMKYKENEIIDINDKDDKKQIGNFEARGKNYKLFKENIPKKWFSKSYVLLENIKLIENNNGILKSKKEFKKIILEIIDLKEKLI
jgi:hypothetical protein